jgi:26S proteasome regulatory subunit N7
MPEAVLSEADPTYMEIASLRFTLAQPGTSSAAALEEAKGKLSEHITKLSMAPFYKTVCEELGWPLDASKLASMEAANATEIAMLTDKIKNCEENEGESEIREAYLARADFLMRIGEKDKAIEAYEETVTKTVALGPKLDIMLAQLRMCLFFEDVPLMKTKLDKAKAMLETGGDWERRNRLKVYEAVFLLQIRDFKASAKLLLDSIATFTATELLPYNTFIFYTVVAALVTLPRKELKAKVIDAPEILQVLHELPHMPELLDGMYNCEYRKLMGALVGTIDAMKADRYLAQHARYYYREVRVMAYTQFMESYRTVSLASMASSFGVSPQYMDKELSAFISAGRLSCKLDAVAGVVNSTRPDAKSAQYLATIKQGDVLLNRVQKLSRVINLDI